MTEVDDFVNHATKITVLVENNFLVLEEPHDPPQPSELVTTETLYRANGEVVELPLIEEDPLHVALKRFLIGDDLWPDSDS